MVAGRVDNYRHRPSATEVAWREATWTRQVYRLERSMTMAICDCCDPIIKSPSQ